MVESAHKFAYEYVRNELDYPRNTKSGNMRLQKLLYFSQLVHFAEFGKPLFDDPIYAYEKGCVVDSVLNDYHRYHYQFIHNAYTMTDSFTSSEGFTLDLVKEVYGGKDAEELSDLNHDHECWKIAFKRSYVSENYKEKSLSKVEKDEAFENDVKSIKKVVDAYKESRKHPEEAVYILGGTEFYYDPREIMINDELISYLDNFAGEEEAFSIYMDPSQGVIVY